MALDNNSLDYDIIVEDALRSVVKKSLEIIKLDGFKVDILDNYFNTINKISKFYCNFKLEIIDDNLYSFVSK